MKKIVHFRNLQGNYINIATSVFLNKTFINTEIQVWFPLFFSLMKQKITVKKDQTNVGKI